MNSPENPISGAEAIGPVVVPPKLTIYNPGGGNVEINPVDGSVSLTFFLDTGEAIIVNLDNKAAGQIKERLPSGSGIVPVQGLIRP